MLSDPVLASVGLPDPLKRQTKRQKAISFREKSVDIAFCLYLSKRSDTRLTDSSLVLVGFLDINIATAAELPHAHAVFFAEESRCEADGVKATVIDDIGNLFVRVS